MTVLMTRRAHGALVVCALCLALPLTACRQSESSSVPLPASSSAADLTTSGTPTSSGWRQQFSAMELAAYDAAVARLDSYESEAEPVWARGKATPEARKLFQKYFPAPVWQIYFSRLKTYEQVDVKIVGLPTILWSKGTKISSADGAVGSVVVRQCVDYTTQTVSQYGNPVDRFRTPVLRSATFDGSRASGWLIVEMSEPVEGKAKPCSGADA